MEDTSRVDAFRSVMKRYPEFAIDLVVASTGEARVAGLGTPTFNEERPYRCADCRTPNHKNLADVGLACLSPCEFCSFTATGAAWSLLLAD